MRSKTSYFNPTLFKKNLTRFWPLWGGASALGALAPLALLMIMVEDRMAGFDGQPLEFTRACYCVLAYVVPIISLLYALLCALAVWGWLYNARSVGMLHALPITRKGIFTTNFLSGLAMMLIPYAVTGTLVMLIALVAGVFEPVGVFLTILGVLGESFFYFASATAVVFVTGNPFAFAVFYSIFHFFAFLAEWLVSALMTKFYFGVSTAYEGMLEFFSPTLYLINNVRPGGHYQIISTPDGWIDNGVLESVWLENWHWIAVYALVGAALLALAWTLYRRRRSESAGDVVAVGWMKPIFRYGCALCAAVAGGMVLYIILFESLETGSTAAVLPMALCMAAAGLTGYYIASMLLAKSLRVFRGSVPGAAATAAAALLLCFAVAADPAGVRSWVPAADSLESLSINVNLPWTRNVGATLYESADIQKVLDLQSAILAEEEVLDDGRGEKRYAGIYLTYRKADGTIAWRDYFLCYNAAILESSAALAQLQAVLTDPAVQEDNIFGSSRNFYDSEKQDVRLTSGYVGDVYSEETGEIEGLDLTLEQARAVEAAVRRDIQAGHFGKTALLTSGEESRGVIYYGDLMLNYTITDYSVTERGRSQRGPYTYGTTASFSISVYCTETIKALEETGALDAKHRLLTQMEYDALQENSSYSYSSEDPHREYSEKGIYYPDGIVYPEEAF